MPASRMERLLGHYRRTVALPWKTGLSGSERVWFAVYEPSDERRLRLRLADFQEVTQQSGHTWCLLDVTDEFPAWLCQHQYRDTYFERYHSNPTLLDRNMEMFRRHLVEKLRQQVATLEDAQNAVVAVSGIGALFGLVRISTLAEELAAQVPGRLLVFFPGSYDRQTYRFLDARDGWDYRFLPITSEEAM